VHEVHQSLCIAQSINKHAEERMVPFLNIKFRHVI
jgi:hypothetical protein